MCGGFLSRTAFRFTLKVTASWSLTPRVFTIIDGFEVSIRSRILPESIHVGLFVMFCRPNSLMIYRSLLCLLAVLFLAISCLLQLISGRLKSPVMSTFGVFCVLYSFVRDSCRASILHV